MAHHGGGGAGCSVVKRAEKRNTNPTLDMEKEVEELYQLLKKVTPGDNKVCNVTDYLGEKEAYHISSHESDGGKEICTLKGPRAAEDIPLLLLIWTDMFRELFRVHKEELLYAPAGLKDLIEIYQASDKMKRGWAGLDEESGTVAEFNNTEDRELYVNFSPERIRRVVGHLLLKHRERASGEIRNKKEEIRGLNRGIQDIQKTIGPPR